MSLNLLLKSRLYSRFPKALAIIDKPVGELFQLDAGINHYLCLFFLGWIRVGNVFWRHHPVFQVVYSATREYCRFSLI